MEVAVDKEEKNMIKINQIEAERRGISVMLQDSELDSERRLSEVITVDKKKTNK